VHRNRPLVLKILAIARLPTVESAKTPWPKRNNFSRPETTTVLFAIEQNPKKWNNGCFSDKTEPTIFVRNQPAQYASDPEEPAKQKS